MKLVMFLSTRWIFSVKYSVLTIFLGTKTHTHTPDLTATSTEYFFDIRKCLNACTRLNEWIALICVKRFSSSFYMRIVVHCIQNEIKFKDTQQKNTEDKRNSNSIGKYEDMHWMNWKGNSTIWCLFCFVLLYNRLLRKIANANDPKKKKSSAPLLKMHTPSSSIWRKCWFVFRSFELHRTVLKNQRSVQQ